MNYERKWGVAFNSWVSLLLLYSAFNTAGDSLALLTGSLESRLVSHTPVWVKLIKDVLMVVAVGMIVSYGRKIDKFLLFLVGVWISIGLVFSFFEAGDDVAAALMGIRYMLPAIYLIFGYSFSRISLRGSMVAVWSVLLLHISMQILQSVFAPNFFGHTLWGYNLRNTGIFVTPTFAGAFPLLCYFWPGSEWMIKSIALTSVFLSNSTTCLVIVILLVARRVICFVKPIYRAVIGIGCAAILVPVLILYLPQITGRGDAVWVSSSTRGDIVAENINYVSGFGGGFGLGTSMAVLQKIPGSVIADNTIVSSIVSMGWIGLLLTSVLLVVISYGLYLRDPLLMALFVGMSMTVIIFESTPFVQVLLIWAGQALYQRSHPSPPYLRQDLSILNSASAHLDP